jgi:hypothetical protein
MGGVAKNLVVAALRLGRATDRKMFRHSLNQQRGILVAMFQRISQISSVSREIDIGFTLQRVWWLRCRESFTILMLCKKRGAS